MTASPLTDWMRAHYRPGGADPLLFYAVFGPFDSQQSMSSSQYRSAGMPEGVDLRSYGPGSHPEVLDTFRQGYLWEQLRKQQPSLANEVAEASQCLVIRGGPKDPSTLNYLRDVVGLIQWRFDHGACTVYDPQMLHWWTAAQWRERAFEPDGPVPRHHVIILVSEEDDGTQWFHTRGMRKFGRPDLSVHQVSPQHRDAVVELLHRFIELQGFGGIIADGQEIRMAALPPGMTCWRRGDLEDPDFNNEHVEIIWPPEPARTPER